MHGERRVVVSGEAPSAIGPYSQAVLLGNVLWCSGALPLDPATGLPVVDSLDDATTRCLQNLEAVCRAAATELSNAVRLTVYTTRLDRFAEINEAFSRFFTDAPPARVAVGVAALPREVEVEIDAVVVVP